MLEKDLVLQYLVDFQEKELPDFIERELRVPLKKDYVIAVIGPRRSGKTFYFYQLMRDLPREETLYLNFEHPIFEGFETKDIVEVLKLHREAFGEPKYVFLDEVQNVHGWERMARYLNDEGYHTFLTGSSSKLLSGEIATSMRGRSLTYTLLPFSFREFLRAKGVHPKKPLSSKKEAMVKSMLTEYLNWGGFPQVVLETNETVREKLLSEYLDMVVYKDIVERYGVRNLHVMKMLIRSLMRSFAKEFSVHAFYNTLKSQGMKVGKGVLYEYLSYVEDSMSVFLLKKFSYSLKVSELSIPKVYPVDAGFTRMFSFSPDIGRLMELAVFLELKRKGREVYYYKNHREVDFVIVERGMPIELIQVTYAFDRSDIKPREVEGLKKAGEKLKVDRKLVITWDYSDEKEGVEFVPLWKWLLRGNL
ncbi:ATP-binding protein [Thermococcus sp. AM4]|uniref:ATP-binding protein n=1 Tax=Thermococcus sp. (strain AM4) TaxID=246969 RepID=UPI0001870E4C|nr:ATP-binding protein [Thermococcus sp. AM4]EEB74229.1 ATPase [Thermococcus sp. AM4]